MRKLAWKIIFPAAILLVFHSSWLTGLVRPSDGESAQVVRAVDGDTIEIRLGDRTEKIRYLGIDTPESVKRGVPVQCFAKRAAREQSRLTVGKSVQLTYDVRRTDRYGRTLAYVAVDGHDVGAQLLAGGFARARRVPPNVARAGKYARLEREARRSRKGLWDVCETQ